MPARDLRTLHPGRRFELGPFRVEPVRVTHSTPDSVALAIRTPAGLIVHSGDFKIDPTPVDGQLFDTRTLRPIRGRRRCAVAVGFDQRRAARTQRIGKLDAARSAGPDQAHSWALLPFVVFLTSSSDSPVGRGLRMRPAVTSCRWGGGWRKACGSGWEPGSSICRPERLSIGARPISSRARSWSSLPAAARASRSRRWSKLAADTHPQVHVERNDVVVLSSRFIPGNERTINTLVNNLFKRGAEVFYDAVAPVHVSGHASRDELIELIKLVRPTHFVPIHGEYRHLETSSRAGDRSRRARRRIASCSRTAIPLRYGERRAAARTHRDRGADLWPTAKVSATRGCCASGGRLAHDGTVVAIVAISARNGKIVAGPDLLSRGVVSGDGTSPHIARARTNSRCVSRA